MKTASAALIAAAMILPLMPHPADAQSRGSTAAAWKLVEEGRIGGEEAEFGEIRGVVPTRTGKVMVLDYKLHEIKLFDARGRLVKRVARDGQGPGEIRDANGLALAPDGSVWVNDPANSRFSIFSPDGDFVRQVTVPITSYGYIWEGAIDASGRAIDPISIRDTVKKQYIGGYVRLIRPDGKADTVQTPMCSPPPPASVTTLSFRNENGGMMMGIPYVPRLQRVITAKGTVWCTPSHEYRLSIGKAGQPLREVVRRAVPSVPVTSADRQRSERMIDSLMKIYGKPQTGSAGDIPKTKPVIARIVADDAGNVWVRRTDAKEQAPTFDVFNEAGQMIATVQSPAPVGHQVYIYGSTLMTVILDEYDLPTVVRYRIQKSRS